MATNQNTLKKYAKNEWNNLSQRQKNASNVHNSLLRNADEQTKLLQCQPSHWYVAQLKQAFEKRMIPGLPYGQPVVKFYKKNAEHCSKSSTLGPSHQWVSSAVLAATVWSGKLNFGQTSSRLMSDRKENQRSLWNWMGSSLFWNPAFLTGKMSADGSVSMQNNTYVAQLVRALRPYRRGHGFESRLSHLNFFRCINGNCLDCLPNSRIQFNFKTRTSRIIFFI